MKGGGGGGLVDAPNSLRVPYAFEIITMFSYPQYHVR